MKRDNQQRRLNDLDRQRSGRRWILSFQGYVTQRVDMEHALVVVRLARVRWRTIIRVCRCRVLVMMVIVNMHSGMVIEVNMRRQCVDGAPVLFVDLVRMRLRGAG